MKSVFLVSHSYVTRYYLEKEIEDGKIIGIFSSKDAAKIIVNEYKKISGFKKHKNGFIIEEYVIDKKYWTEGF